MTSINKDKIKEDALRCYNFIYENDKEIKSRVLEIVNRYCDRYKRLEIDKEDLIKYLKLRDLEIIYYRIEHLYIDDDIISKFKINETYNKEKYREVREYLFQYNCYELFYEEKMRDDYKFIYYNIIKLKEENKKMKFLIFATISLIITNFFI